MSNSRINNHKRYNFNDFEADYQYYLNAVINLKRITVKNYLSDARHFSGWLHAHTDVKTFHDISSSTIVTYENYLTKDGIPDRTIRRRLSSLRTLFRFAIAQGWIKSNPAKRSHSKQLSSASETPSTSGAVASGEHTSPYMDILTAFEGHIIASGEDASRANELRETIEEFMSVTHSQQHDHAHAH